MYKNKWGMLFSVLLLLCLVCPALAEDYVPSVTPQRPVILEAVDADGNDVTDLLVITPYTMRQEMQDYKIMHFEEAYQGLSWDMIGQVLADTLTEDMNPRNLMIERLFYVHEKGDSGIVKLPVTVRFSTDISAHDYCEMITYRERSTAHGAPGLRAVKRAPAVHEWFHIPSTNNGDGTITVFVDHYGPYATVFYRVKEQPSVPDDFSGEGENSPVQVPHSPQTGERKSLLWLVVPAVGIILGKRWLERV